jgi:branched-chain amino acid transport system substrate-binding protein
VIYIHARYDPFFKEIRRMKSLRIVVLVAVLAMAFAGAGSSAHAQAKKVIKIATQSPLSGEQANVGVGIKNGAELAIEQLGGALDKLGYTVQIAPFDDQATPDVGVANAQNIINDPAILGVVGHYNSGVAIPSSEVYNTVNLVMVSPANTNPKVTDRNLPTVNRVCGRDDIQGAKIGGVFLDFAKEKLGVKTVYIVNSNTAYGKGVAEFFRQAAEARGITVLGFESTEEKSNFDAVLTPIKAQNPDLVYWGGEITGANFLKQMRDKGIKAVFAGPDGLDDPDFAKITGDAGVGAYFTTVAGPAEGFPKAKDFVTAYTTKYGKAPPPYAAQAYDAAHIVLNAIEKVAKDTGALPTRKDVAAAVRATKDFEGLTSNITFDVKGDPLKAAYYLVKVTSADPLAWGKNEIVQTFEIDAPPLPVATPAK